MDKLLGDDKESRVSQKTTDHNQGLQNLTNLEPLLNSTLTTPVPSFGSQNLNKQYKKH